MKQKLCECGCNNFVKEGNRFIFNHHLKGNNHTLGYKHTKETRLKMSRNMKGNNYALGYKHTKETRLKMSFAHKVKPRVNGMLGKKHSKETRLKLSRVWKGRKHSKETREKMSICHKGKKNSMYGKKHTKKSRIKIRELTLKRIKINGGMCVGNNETIILDAFEKIIGYKILRQKSFIGYSVDGYIEEINTIIEVDEFRHFRINNKLKKKDIIRQKNIENEIGCSFIRLKDPYGRKSITDINQVMNDFKEIIKTKTKFLKPKHS